MIMTIEGGINGNANGNNNNADNFCRNTNSKIGQKGKKKKILRSRKRLNIPAK